MESQRRPYNCQDVRSAENSIRIWYGSLSPEHPWDTIPIASNHKSSIKSAWYYDFWGGNLVKNGVNRHLNVFFESFGFDVTAMGSVEAGEDANVVINRDQPNEPP
ncbi:hypothetical protein EVAR_12023_1 [Eumeta japonica]|uniref:Uncharacterized protein n=1 Tax=Eumeta variegata TaxID=151549 RepID=A0A4C1U500_EUMVA|nr:hypothetical protein EVAR_12023_1 [Eumeta japonica]